MTDLYKQAQLQQAWCVGEKRARRWRNRIVNRSRRCLLVPQGQRSASEVATLYFYAMLAEQAGSVP